MRVNELAKNVGITPDTVRFYTRIGLIKPVKNPENGYKQYGLNDRKRMVFIVKARQLGFTVSEIEEVINMSHKGNSPCGRVRSIVKLRLDETLRNIKALQKLTNRIQSAMETWDHLPDGEPNGDSVCHLIEMWDETDCIPKSH
jgi:DNA-binding transcriptional MerR regulator